VWQHDKENMMTDNSLLKLRTLGQSIWLDYIQRGMLDNGEITRMIEADGLAGMTSNPAIFEKAITGRHDYDAAIASLVRTGASARDLYDNLTRDDVGHAADLLLPVYEKSGGRDGYVSIEVSPHFAHDCDATVKEAHELWAQLARPNVMIKVPGTRAGLPAIQALLAAGVNVNVTLLFGLQRYREVTDAFVRGLEQRAATGAPLDQVASVASFFLSRIDTLVDQRLDVLSPPDTGTSRHPLRGAAAIASARLAYQHYKQWTAGVRWQALAAQGARSQRLLWASTGTKDPDYSDVKYVEALIGPDTVNTLPPDTLAAYRDHGRPALRLEEDLTAAHELPVQLAGLGIDLEQVSDELEADGVKKFIAPFDKLLAALEQRRIELLG
jgi:transaldolase